MDGIQEKTGQRQDERRQVAECEGCHQPVIWAETARLKLVPLEVEPKSRRKTGNH